MKSKEIKLDLTLEQVNIILAGIAELPAKISFELIQNIQTQTNNFIEKSKTE